MGGTEGFARDHPCGGEEPRSGRPKDAGNVSKYPGGQSHSSEATVDWLSVGSKGYPLCSFSMAYTYWLYPLTCGEGITHVCIDIRPFHNPR